MLSNINNGKTYKHKLVRGFAGKAGGGLCLFIVVIFITYVNVFMVSTVLHVLYIICTIYIYAASIGNVHNLIVSFIF